MPTMSFEQHFAKAKDDPIAREEIEEESRRLDAAVALMRAREEAGLSQEQLASLSHISRSTINRIEKARISPSIRTLDALAQAMGKRASVIIS
ncbi:helix-turn-helix domain-containing protein [Bifidobacterium scaligerum]|nr:helix-turn-helix transcriptional regulator [Bifidobacterium scaligerum]